MRIAYIILCVWLRGMKMRTDERATIKRACMYCGYDGLREDYAYCPMCGRRILKVEKVVVE